MLENNLPLDTEQKNLDAAVGKLAIEALYVREQSCKVPYAPGIYQNNTHKEAKPETHLEMNIKHYPQQANQFEVILILHLTMKINQQTAFVVEVQQAGLFRIEGFAKEQEAYLLGAYCPGIIFPYARKAVSDLVLGAGFAAVPLPPINFESLYQQRLQNAQTKAKEGDATTADTFEVTDFKEEITLN